MPSQKSRRDQLSRHHRVTSPSESSQQVISPVVRSGVRDVSRQLWSVDGQSSSNPQSLRSTERALRRFNDAILSSSSNEQRILEVMLDSCMEVLNPSVGVVLKYSSDDDSLFPCALRGFPDTVPFDRQPMDRGVVAKAASSRQPILASDTTSGAWTEPPRRAFSGVQPVPAAL